MAKKDKSSKGGEKPQVNLAFIGHVDHGKSTLVTRILLASGAVNPHTIEQYRKLAEEEGKPGFEFAYVMDDLPEERSRGVTIRAQIKKFDTKQHHFTISDAPGHQDYVSNMIKGTSQAEAAVLLVDAKEGVMPQTREHLILAKTFGINQVLIAVNKMDATIPPYSKDVFNSTVNDVSDLFKEIGFKDDQYSFIPVSAIKNDNISERSQNMSWYKDRTLINKLDDFGFFFAIYLISSLTRSIENLLSFGVPIPHAQKVHRYGHDLFVSIIGSNGPSKKSSNMPFRYGEGISSKFTNGGTGFPILISLEPSKSFTITPSIIFLFIRLELHLYLSYLLTTSKKAFSPWFNTYKSQNLFLKKNSSAALLFELILVKIGPPPIVRIFNEHSLATFITSLFKFSFQT